MGSNDLYIGLISGTSADGIDAALVSFDKGRPELLAQHLHPFPDTTKARLMSLFTPGEAQIDLMGAMDQELGLLFADACLALLDSANMPATAVNAIGSHGQTVRHRPDQPNPFTLQIGDPNCIAHVTGIDVVADFRRRDMACGGQGAPLAPLFHQTFFSDENENRVILNLGGIANITMLPATKQATHAPIAMDTGPASGLMDAWCQQHLGKAFDANGEWAKQGSVITELLNMWLDDPYFAKPAPKSTGKEYFNLSWLEARASRVLAQYQPEDIQATLLELTVRSVCDAIAALPMETSRVLVCGGGVHNRQLVERLQALSSCPVDSTMMLGIDPDWVEAMCFAWLAMCFNEGIKMNTGPFTGASEPVLLGGLYKK
ncbi:anhydro-N-acetylmuramic acid kinase [Ketobacter alkanivorans]|uniref:Anhydro-N-acetylmuramic acid kinase n=1 Tax=Ketobacter alkanivorans TaxID=1917421 RepID=A0A2K9LIA6_9GAMM|nr:anhydro-N-acetylmuramic acid kinase [Ketobacter alkanivorans]AUM12088.1 anhydro-N-acetylmuramic acid kinase [Ketobacter alkanivorans]